MGFTAYDKSGNVLHQRLPSFADTGDSEEHKVSAEIYSITFETNSWDGFYGLFEVTTDGVKQSYTCINCLPSSPSTELGRIYIDKEPMNGALDVEGAANCPTSCHFTKVEGKS